MPTLIHRLKALSLAAALAAGGLAFAQDGDHWYSGLTSGFWGLGNSVGFRSSLPGAFGMPGVSPEGLTTQKQFGGYRVSDAFSIEGAQTSFGLNGTACGGDPLTGDAYRSCYGAAWSLSGVATLPFQSGLSLYGRLGLHYWQKGAQEDTTAGRHGLDDMGRVLGVGMSYEFSKSITFHAETERYTDLTNGNGTSPGSSVGLDASVHSIGLSIKF